jgi:hypothetical protein
MYTISKLITDDFTYPMFRQVTRSLAPDVLTYYMWSNPPSTMESCFKKIYNIDPVVIFFLKFFF